MSAGNPSKLTQDDVLDIMRRRGRGNEIEEAASAAPGVSSAWADFMEEEGVTQEGADSSLSSNPAADTAAGDAAASSGKRTYIELGDEDKAKAASGKKGPKKSKLNHEGGIVLQCGTLDSSIVGRSRILPADKDKKFHLSIPRSIAPHIQVSRVFTGCNAAHSLLLDASQTKLYGWGRNEIGQLGDALDDDVVLPTLLQIPFDDSTVPIRMAACGKGHTVVLQQDGTCWASGANKSGQCGVGMASDMVPNFRKCIVPDGVKLVHIACGEDFTVALDEEGKLYSTGSSEYGQLGNGETGEYFITANKLAFANCLKFTLRTTFCHAINDNHDKIVPLPDSLDIRLASVACGKHHCIAVERPSKQHRARVFSWGCGNYGCLGHGIQKDEYFPRVISALSTIPTETRLDVQAGSTCSLLRVDTTGHLYYWGKHKQNSEATMRPQLNDILANNQHHVTFCAAGGQTVVCTTQLGQTIAYGQGPYGELGLGDKKSSSKPAFVENLDGKVMVDLACGYGHTLFVVGGTKVDGIEDLADKDVEHLVKAAKSRGMQKRI